MNLTRGHNGEHTPTAPITMNCETCGKVWTVTPDDGRTVEESALGHGHGHDCTVIDVAYDGHDTITVNCDPPAYRFTGDAWRGKSVNNYYVRNPVVPAPDTQDEPLWFDQDVWWSEFWRMVRAEDGYGE